MKKLFAMIAVFAISTAMFAQVQTEKKMETKQATAKAAHSDYAMMNGKMTHCMGDRHEPMMKDVTLKNGTLISTNGEVITKGGKKTMMKDGQCINMSGKMGTMEEMHPGMKKEAKGEM